ncbi:NfeD family protein [Rickettsiales bacterium]|nr:NfeD family protein [Rickettsiales bacterium]
MQSLLTEHISIIWLTLGAIFIIIEVFFTPGIGFLFAGLGAVSVGGLIIMQISDSSNYWQQILFFLILTSVWASFLWKPLKKLLNSSSDINYKDVEGGTAIVVDSALTCDKEGQVKWSGTIMNARLEPKVQKEEVEVGQEVKIIKVDGNTLIVSSKNK